MGYLTWESLTFDFERLLRNTVNSLALKFDNLGGVG